MNNEFIINLPKLGESIVSARIVKWLKKEGELVSLDEPLVEVSTDKVNSEIPSPFAGILFEILVREDEEIDVGAPLARIQQKNSSFVPSKKEVNEPEEEFYQESASSLNSFLSPAVLRQAELEGISFEALKTISGSGTGGRITKKDVEKFVSSKAPQKNVSPLCPLSKVDHKEEGREERVKMSGMRKMIAENMVRSFYEAPHASLVTEVDVTEVMKMIRKEKERFGEAHGVKLTITAFLVQALAKTLTHFPMLNASLDQETIIMKRYINVGIAVNVEKGLVVPVIKNCHEKNLVTIAKSLGELASKARQSKLAPDEVQEGTITLTNFGMTKALMGVPIIRYPEVAIIGAGTIQKRVVVRDDDSLAIREMMYLTLTFDHRVIDGIYGCEFLESFRQNLESFQ